MRSAPTVRRSRVSTRTSSPATARATSRWCSRATLTARENVELALQLAGADHIPDRAAAALDSFGLSRRADNYPSGLSGGEQQRVAIAGAAAREAKLLLADEPTGELDVGNEKLVLEALERLRSEHDVTVLVVTHSSGVAAAADRVIQMRDGRRVA